MKVNVKTVLKDFKGNAVKASPSADSPDVTLAMVALVALQQESQDNLNQKLEIFRVMKAISESEEGDGTLDLKSEQVTLIKEKIGKVQSPMVVGLCAELLDG